MRRRPRRIRVEKIANQLGHPFAIVAMPDGRLMVTIKSGYMEIRDRNGALVKKITGFPAVVYAGQGGLLDVAFDPKFTMNKIIYWCYSEEYSGENLTAVAKGKLNEAEGKVEDVFGDLQCHAGDQQYFAVRVAAGVR